MRTLAVAPFLCLVASPAWSAPLPLDTWEFYSWSGLGAIDSPADGYQLTAPSGALLRVTDCCLIGDEFDVFVDDVLAFATSATDPADDGIDGPNDADDTWADPRYSKGSILLAPGTYQIDIDLTRLTSAASSGGAFIRADSVRVPAPGTLLLLGLGMAGFGPARLRRARL